MLVVWDPQGTMSLHTQPLSGFDLSFDLRVTLGRSKALLRMCFTDTVLVLCGGFKNFILYI